LGRARADREIGGGVDNVSIRPPGGMGKGFIPVDEYRHRDAQAPWPKERWRHLEADEIERLEVNGNDSDAWEEVLVTDGFDTDRIRNTRFFGMVRIGTVRDVVLEHHDLRVPAGITNSVLTACDIGDDAAVHNVAYMAHVIVGDRSILMNIDEMHATNHAKFGNGIVKEGEPEDVRVWLDLMNETGCRSVLPFDGIIPADAYLWAKYRDDAALQEKLKTITQNGFDASLGCYATVGDQCVIKSCRILKDVKIGPHCYIKGANKLKNLTINSSEAEPTQIGEGVELVNGIVGYGCRVFYGCKAVRFVLGNNSNLKYGARLINSLLGDNSTISCCEVLNALIFPAHEQHHNNSFLIASLIMGQSNLAAGATIGSNHNSRANDNELQAGRGFWPGLCSSLKHPCRFASFVLLSKADYPAEMDIPLPFSLLNNNAAENRLEVMPAYWWLYNMYALARNTGKFQDRDRRKNKVQHIEFDFLAPDTVEEIIIARGLLEVWVAKAHALSEKRRTDGGDSEGFARKGAELLRDSPEMVDRLEVLGENMEKSDRKVVILKARKAYNAYTDMLHYYAVKTLINSLLDDPRRSFAGMCDDFSGAQRREWVNLGGQLAPCDDVDRLRSDIGNGSLASWKEIHERYDALWERYPREKYGHAFATLCVLLGTERPAEGQWRAELDRVMKVQEFIRDQVFISRKKDFENPFHRTTYRHEAEMTACIGTVEDNAFIKQVRAETETFRNLVEEIRERGGRGS
jgi:carbonic anhydrase/acetyltransferase-like protein (isoleucine patch superfamily)